MNKTILIAGPTASGKSWLALKIAKSLFSNNKVRIINADSMQVYSELRIVTARPSLEDEKLFLHGLYGTISARESCSAGRWRDLALDEISAARRNKEIPIVVGGTGLYFRALLEGLAPVPDIPEDIRATARKISETHEGNSSLMDELERRDPEIVGKIAATDTQRIVRAWEVLEATGESLKVWQQRNSGPKLDGLIAKVLLEPPREHLYAAIDARILKMVEQGALEEVARLDEMHISPDLPAFKALGVAEFSAVNAGVLPLENGLMMAQQASRRYAKRQSTWYRNQASDWTRFSCEGEKQYLESFWGRIFPFIREFLLTSPG